MAGWRTTINKVATAVQLRFAIGASRALGEAIKARRGRVREERD